jgi:hypothetical protein
MPDVRRRCKSFVEINKKRLHAVGMLPGVPYLTARKICRIYFFYKAVTPMGLIFR